MKKAARWLPSFERNHAKKNSGVVVRFVLRRVRGVLSFARRKAAVRRFGDVDLVAFHSLFETTDRLTDGFSQTRQTLRAEENQNDADDKKDMYTTETHKNSFNAPQKQAPKRAN
ncbi:MAG: hypothetical protein AAB250_14715 [Bdellovibrionota bacterium]